MSSLEVHPKFNAPDADLSILSSDNVLFRLHSKNLQVNSTAFPAELTYVAEEDIAKFDEPSKVLELLFAFLYPDPVAPSLKNTPFDILEPLAYSAHKYGVGGAINVCNIRLSENYEFSDKNPLQVLKYAMLHLTEENVDRIAVYTIAASVEDAFQRLDMISFSAWTLYRDRCFKRYISSGISLCKWADIKWWKQRCLDGNVISFVNCLHDIKAMIL